MKVLGISGTIVGRKTTVIVDEIINTLKEKVDWDLELLDLSNYTIEFCDGREEFDYSADTQEVIRKIKKADAYIIGTPIFNGSFPAPLKNVIDLVPPYSFANKVMGFVSVADNANHYLMIENQLHPIAGHLQAYTPPTYIHAYSSSFDDNNNIVCTDVLKDIDQMIDQFINLNQVIMRKD